MDFIVSEFVNLIKGCSNGLDLEKEVWRRGIELQCQAMARALETYDAELARQTDPAVVPWDTWPQP
jgi:hypothetical protein